MIRSSCDYKDDEGEICGRKGQHPIFQGEFITRGTRLRRTATDAWETWMTKWLNGETDTHPDDAPVKKYEYYCPEHAEELGLI